MVEGQSNVVLKLDLHCEGCVSKIKRSIKGFEGVEGVKTDMDTNKLTVIGKVDAWKLRDRVESKTRKKVEIVSPVNPPKKDADGRINSAVPVVSAPKENKASDAKMPKELAVSIVLLKIGVHCDSCIERIKKKVLKFKGVQDVTVDAHKDLVTVKGTIDANLLPSYLKEKLNRNVEVVQAKNDTGVATGWEEGEKTDKPAAAPTGGDYEKKGKVENNSGQKKDKGGNGGSEKKEKMEDDRGVGRKKEVQAAAEETATPVVANDNKMEYYEDRSSNGRYKMEMLQAAMMFSDKCPIACSIL